MALFEVDKLVQQLQPLYNEFAYEYADTFAAMARANMIYGNVALKGTPNGGNQLRRITGALFKSLGRNDANNIYKFIPNEYGFTIEYGSRLPYAAIHEYGGTINHPGGTPFFIKGGELIFVNKKNPRAAKLPKTKPHSIPIPARPYMAPALQELNANKALVVNKFRYKVAREITPWRAKQRR